jgi:hypothetical protein
MTQGLADGPESDSVGIVSVRRQCFVTIAINNAALINERQITSLTNVVCHALEGV